LRPTCVVQRVALVVSLGMTTIILRVGHDTFQFARLISERL
jgi:hypothetical protein